MTATPVMAWESQDAFDNEGKVVWWARLDNRFHCEVQRTDDGRGTLYIFDHDNNNEVLLEEPTSLMYGAQFGPDVDDVSRWQDICIGVADAIAQGQSGEG